MAVAISVVYLRFMELRHVDRDLVMFCVNLVILVHYVWGILEPHALTIQIAPAAVVVVVCARVVRVAHLQPVHPIPNAQPIAVKMVRALQQAIVRPAHPIHNAQPIAVKMVHALHLAIAHLQPAHPIRIVLRIVVLEVFVKMQFYVNRLLKIAEGIYVRIQAARRPIVVNVRNSAIQGLGCVRRWNAQFIKCLKCVWEENLPHIYVLAGFAMYDD